MKTKDLEPITELELVHRYDAYLDTTYGSVKICGLMYTTSYALKEVDPPAYQMRFHTWLNSNGDGSLIYHQGHWYDAVEFNALESSSNEVES